MAALRSRPRHTRRRGGRPRTLVVPASALVLVLVAAACGGSDSSSGTKTVALSSWKKQVNSLCAAARKDVDAIDQPSDTTDYAVLESSGIAVKKRVNEFIDDVDTLGPPDARAKQATAFVDQWRAYTGDFDGLVAAAKAENQADVEAATTKLQAANEKKDELAKGLGLDECWKDASPTTGDTTGDTLSKNPTSTTTSTTVADAASGNLAPAAWSAEVDAACTRLTEKYQSIGQANPQTVEEAQKVANDLNSFATEIVAEWDRIGPPAGETAPAQELYDLFVQFKQVATEFQNAVAASDSTKLDQITAQIDQLTGQITPLAQSLNVPACGA